MSDQFKQALCCVCGTLRTCRRPRNYRYENYWLHGTVDRDWHRETGDLKCDTCGRVTTHAIILPTGDSFRDHAEKLRDAATGWVLKALTDEGHQRIQQRWREGLPRNPYTRHMWWISDEKKAREAGETHFLAICKERIAVPKKTAAERDSSTPIDAFVEPREFHDVDREDPETGLWWFDMDCTDCLYRANAIALDEKRKALKSKLQSVVDKISALDARTVADLLANFADTENCDT
jgi:hypothetical protein